MGNEKRSLINRIKYKKGLAVVYLLKLKNSKNECYKVGFSTNLLERIEYMPQGINVEILKVLRGSNKDMKALEKFIHKNNADKYTWIGNKWGGYTELYNEEVNLIKWKNWYLYGIPDFDGAVDDDELDEFLTL